MRVLQLLLLGLFVTCRLPLPWLRSGARDCVREFDHETGTVKVRLAGSCVGCAQSVATLQDGVERMLMFYVPEVERVEQVTDTPLDRVNQDEFELLEQKLMSKSK